MIRIAAMVAKKVVKMGSAWGWRVRIETFWLGSVDGGLRQWIWIVVGMGRRDVDLGLSRK